MRAAAAAVPSTAAAAGEIALPAVVVVPEPAAGEDGHDDHAAVLPKKAD